MLRTARGAANVFTGTDKPEHLTDKQLDALLLYEWPQQQVGVTDVDSAGGLGGFIEQLKKEQSIMIVDNLQEEKAQHDREDRRSKIDAGDRSDPQLVELDELEHELSELHQSGALNHYPEWKIDLLEAENMYVNNPEAATICMSRIRVKKLTYEQKQEEIVKLAHTLCTTGITAIPAQVWNESTENVDEQRIVRRLGFVLVAYRVEYWWWEALEMLRKFLMTSLLIFVYPDDPAQMAAGLFITFCFLLANMTFQPFATPSLNALQSFSMVAQFLTLFVGIMMAFTEKKEQDDTNTTNTDRAVVSILIVLVNGTMVLFPVLQLFMKGNFHDNYQLALSWLDRLFHLFTCGKYRPEEKILETLSLKSRLVPDEDSSDDDKDASKFANRDYRHNWDLGILVMHKKKAHASMPVIVQKARVLTSWRNETVFKKRNAEASRNLELADRDLEQVGARNHEVEQQVREMTYFENAQRARVDTHLTAAQQFEPPSAVADFAYDSRPRPRTGFCPAGYVPRANHDPDARPTSPSRARNQLPIVFESMSSNIIFGPASPRLQNMNEARQGEAVSRSEIRFSSGTAMVSRTPA